MKLLELEALMCPILNQLIEHESGSESLRFKQNLAYENVCKNMTLPFASGLHILASYVWNSENSFN